MLEERRLAVLRAIVEDYVSTHEPVGSKALVERHHLGVSPATIRNDMAALEDEGFIAQPHTSAGRVPTDLGYRLFVDRLSGVKPLSPPERRAIHQFLDEAVDLDDVMSRTVRLLAQITRQVALVQYPSLQRSSIRHVELVSLSSTRLILVIIVDTGRVEQRLIECPGPVVRGRHRRPARPADRGARRQAVLRVADAVQGFEDAFPPADRPLVRVVLSGVLESVAERHDERVVLGGTAHLARYGEAFPIAIQPVLEALEEQVVLLQPARRGGEPPGRHGPHRAREPGRGARGDVRHHGAVRARRPARRLARRGRPHAHGLPRHDGGRARRRALRQPHPGRAVGGSVSTDYYALLGVPRDASPGGDQEGLPAAGARAPSRRQPRSRAPGAVQAGHRRLRGAQRPREAPDVRPGRRSAQRQPGRRLRPGRLRLRRHHGRVLRRRRAARPAHPRPARPGRAHPHPGRPRRRGVRQHPRPHGRHRRPLQRRATRSARRPGSTTETCVMCKGRGEIQQVQRSFLGQVMTSRPCPQCQGFGTTIPHPCHECSGDGRVRTRRTLTVQIPPGRRHGHAHPALGRGRGGPERRSGRRPVRRDRRRRRTTCSSVAATSCTASSPCP